MNMMEKIKMPQVEINLSDWQGAGISERETKKELWKFSESIKKVGKKLKSKIR